MSLLWVKVVGAKKIFNTEDTGDTEEYQGLPQIVALFRPGTASVSLAALPYFSFLSRFAELCTVRRSSPQ